MKKFLSIFVIVAFMAGISFSADNTKRPGYYDDKGYSASEMVGFVLDSSTVAGNQLKRRVNLVPITLITAGEDSLETAVMGVPTGQAVTITGLFLTAFTEISGSNDSAWAEILWYNAGTLDTMVARFAIDADSADYDNNLLELTRIDSVLAAGDAVFWRTIALEGAATGAVGPGLVLEYLLSE